MGINPTIEEVCYKAATFERMCRFTYDILAAGREPQEVPAEQRPDLKKLVLTASPQPYWEGAVRRLIANESEVLR